MSAIEEAIAVLRHLADRLRYLQPPVSGLIAAACRMGRAGYLAGTRDRMAAGAPFPQSWREALLADPGGLGEEELAVLLPLGELLGATDLDSQLSGLSLAREQLEHRLHLARHDREKNHKLYSTLGVLAGVAVAIILV